MKKLFLSLILCMFLISFVNAAEFDNWKTYNSETKEVTITNWFNQGETIAKVKLLSPLANQVPVGYNEVARFKVSAYQDYNQAIKEIELYNIKNNMAKFSREMDIKVLSYENISVNDYGRSCVEGIVNQNGSITNICSIIITGSHIETKEKWTKLTPADFKKNDELIIAFFTNVKMGDYVEFIPNVFGVRVEEWASWSAITSFSNNWVGRNQTATVTDSTYAGVQIKANRNITITNVTTFPGDNSPTCRITDDSNNLLAESSVTSNVATFNFQITNNGSIYRVVCGASTTMGYNNDVFAGMTYTDINMTNQIYGGNVNNGGHRKVWYVGTSANIAGSSVTLNSPINGYNLTSSSINFNCTANVIGATFVNITLWTNISGTFSANKTISTNGDIIPLTNIPDGSYLWNCRACDSDGDCGFSTSNRTFTKDTTSPVVTILAPNSSYIVKNPAENITINVSIVHPAGALSSCYYHTDVNTTFTYFNCSLNTSTIFPPSNPATLNIEVHANDTFGNTGFSNVTITKDTSLPTVTILYPTTLITNAYLGQNTSLNYSIVDTNTQSCWYNYNGTNITTPCNSNTTFILSNSQSITLYANDSFNNLNNASITWQYSLLENSRSYSNPVTEFSTDTFQINLSIASTWTSRTAYLIRDGVSYTSTEVSTGLFSNTISIPSGSGSKNLYWMINLSNATANTLINTATTTQNVTPIGFLLCNSTSNVSFLHFETRSIDTKQLVNATFKSTLYVGIGDSRKNVTYNDVNENVSSWNFCLTPASATYRGEITIQYDANLYSQNYYYLVNTTLTNATSNITLYLLNESKTTLTTITTYDRATFPYAGLYSRIQQYDVGTDTYYTVAMTKANHEGNDIAYLYWYDTLYKMVILENNTILQTTNPFKISYTPQTFRIVPDESPNYLKFENVQYSLTYNNITGNVVLTFTTGDARVTSGCLRVLKQTATNETQVCNTCETSSSATVYCNLLPYGNGTYISTFYATGSLSNIDTLEVTIGVLHELYNLIGNEDASFYAFLLAGIVWVFFMVNPVMGVIGALLGFGVGMAFGFTYFSMGTFITLVIGGIIVIWIIKR